MFNSVALLLVITPIFGVLLGLGGSWALLPVLFFAFSENIYYVTSELALRIGGGRKMPNGSAPYQVSVRDRRQGHFCGGSVISSRAILTAAHCVEWTKPELLKVVVGTNQLSAGGQSYSIRRIVSHAKYDSSGVNDIAIMFTDKEIQFTDKVQAVELSDEPVQAGEELLVTGWGTTSYPGPQPNDLMELVVNAVSYEDCKTALEGTIPVFKTQICAVAEAGKGTCKGDSGGPLVDVDEGKLVGIVSEGEPCATGKPDVYTSVHSFMPWIEEVLYEYGNDESSLSDDYYNDEDDDDHYIYFNVE